ncbi:DUF4835 domain-containing protein [Brumimicrobium salinarum]|uniref:DUF4835 domain-containing protein n=1 Tax=Brumimicrobium salinarum TaxID=2058658 RepID=A0A2I0R4P5_9FLAO|nr:DUF4835 family protein [Brumimicrobium salinarum]PKR81564.1 DUF4835 domain-containing protein [Brumimicrobium salinarum]
MKKILVLLFIAFSFSYTAQELNCQVNVQINPTLQVSTTDKEIFQELEQSIFEIMNNTSWTKDEFEVEERINCVFQLSITEVLGSGNYQATVQVQATRPVFNTSYNTTLFNYLDEDVHFNFRRGAKIIYSENQFTDNLSSIMAFYAFYILGLDGDSFANQGGSPYLKKAQEITMMAQSSMMPGWKADEKGRKNRYWLVENSLQELFSPLRECFYDYHRKGLDRMYDNQELARTEVHNALKKLMNVNRSRPGSVNVLNFLTAKRQEVIGIFKDAERKQQTEVVNLLKRIDPTNASKYQEIIQ